MAVTLTQRIAAAILAGTADYRAVEGWIAEKVGLDSNLHPILPMLVERWKTLEKELRLLRGGRTSYKPAPTEVDVAKSRYVVDTTAPHGVPFDNKLEVAELIFRALDTTQDLGSMGVYLKLYCVRNREELIAWIKSLP